MLTRSSFITFYPFCAVFSLYEYILACTDPGDCEEDVQALEAIGSAMAEISDHRPNFLPFSRTINALNKVSRTLQEERKRAKLSKESQLTDPSASLDLNQQDFTIDNLHGLVANELPAFDSSAFAFMPDSSTTFDSSLHPAELMRALENDIFARNWNENWWDMSGAPPEVMIVQDRYK